MSEININDAAVESEASELANASSQFISKPLSPKDSRTTIAANADSQQAYESTQETLQTFGAALDQEAANIRSINVEFKEYDQMLGKMIEEKVQ